MNTLKDSPGGPSGPPILAPEEGVLYDLQFDCPVCGLMRPVAVAISGCGLVARCEACGEQVPRVIPISRQDPERHLHPYEGLG